MEVALMDTLQSYFSYVVTTECGFPAITLEGTVADWRKLREKAESLGKYDLDWWMPHLLPVVDQFVAASEGNPSREFWCNFYKWERDGSGSRLVNGHVNALFPYFGRKAVSKDDLLANYETFLRDSYLRDPTEDRIATLLKRLEARLDAGTTSYGTDTLRRNPRLEKDGRSRGFEVKDIATTMNSTPFVWQYHGAPLQMQLLAGFVGATQDPDTLAVRPTLGWAVREGTG